MCLIDEKGIIKKVNSSFCKLVDIKRIELEGQKINIAYKNDDELIDKYLKYFNKKEIPSRIEKQFQLHNDEIKCFEIVNSYVEIPGEPLQLLSIFHDTTQRKSLERDLKIKNKELLATSQLSSLVNKSLDIDKVINTALIEILSIFKAESGIIYTSNDQSSKYFPQYHINIPDKLLNEIDYITEGRFIAGRILEQGKPILIYDLHDIPDLVPKTALEEGFRSYIGIPIIIKQKVIGVISLADQEIGYFTDINIDILKRMGLIIGIAINNAKLFQESQQLINEQKKTKQDLGILLSHITGLEENFRKNAARKIHDNIGQNLTALSLNITTMERNIKDPVLINRIDDSHALIQDIIKQANNVVSELSPTILYEKGLFSAIKWHINSFIDRTGINVDFYGHEIKQSLPDKYKINIYRSFQEILNNIVKHANAENVLIKLSQNDRTIFIYIIDDGEGFDSKILEDDDNLDHFGLKGIKERIKILGGAVEIVSDPGVGTKVLLKINIPEKN